MQRLNGQAAAWTAHLLSHLHNATTRAKRTHKLPEMPCVLWLPTRQAYLRSLDLLKTEFTTSPNADSALRLGESQAEAIGQDLIDMTGLRVQVRAFHPCH